MSIEFIITIIIAILGFLGLTITILQINNSVRADNRTMHKELKSEMKDLSTSVDKLETKIEDKLDYTNQRIDKLYDVLGDLYRALIKKDAA